ncbi:hypothetical protein Suden_1625 [Sulfurimonas denitrificans DSM 1251]|uniref:ParA family protein n=1 Tax=Sulfurimonas denitrificans (strain ATCC 33889 / DSM 1251) TaxID=326298 RepID=Q30Q29_SULDN|nr:hypothetical protein [Sulfurimonas denitrificans]ABB44902.1 hypothetical protein Suden_1625 [Sulfurimonas denitrificans DSM 1251]
MKTIILEIDDNNNSNVFHKSQVIESKSVVISDGEEAFGEMLFEQMSTGSNLIVDLGGGNDSKKGLEIIKKADRGDWTYIVPVGNSLSSAKNAKDTFELIGRPENTVFALNQVYDMSTIRKDWMFWFGNKALGISSLFEELNNPKTIMIPLNPFFEIAATAGYTVGEFAQICEPFLEMPDIREVMFEKSGRDKNKYLKLWGQYCQSVEAKNTLDKFMPQIADTLGQPSNIAVCSTKGGVGKSTLSHHVLSLL